MDVPALSRLLYDLCVPPELYRLDGSQYELAHVLTNRDGEWAVFLSERGTESDIAVFKTEHDACVTLLGRVCLDLAERGRLIVRDAEGSTPREARRALD